MRRPINWLVIVINLVFLHFGTATSGCLGTGVGAVGNPEVCRAIGVVLGPVRQWADASHQRLMNPGFAGDHSPAEHPFFMLRPGSAGTGFEVVARLPNQFLPPLTANLLLEFGSDAAQFRFEPLDGSDLELRQWHPRLRPDSFAYLPDEQLDGFAVPVDVYQAPPGIEPGWIWRD